MSRCASTPSNRGCWFPLRFAVLFACFLCHSLSPIRLTETSDCRCRLQNQPRSQHFHQSQPAVAVHGAGRRRRLRAVVATTGEHGEPALPIYPQSGAGCRQYLIGIEGPEPLAFQRAINVFQGRIAQCRTEKDVAVIAGDQDRAVERHRLNRALPSQLQTVPQGVVQSSRRPRCCRCNAGPETGSTTATDLGWRRWCGDLPGCRSRSSGRCAPAVRPVT